MSAILNQIPVSEVMSIKVFSVSPDKSVLDAHRLMRRKHLGGLPVVEEGKIIGIITQKDIDTIEYSERQKVKVKDIMKDQLVTVSTKETLDAAHRKMSDLRVTRLPVMSERGSLVGMITLNDIDRAMKDARARRFPNPKSLKCPNDGSPLPFTLSGSVKCGHCGAVITI